MNKNLDMVWKILTIWKWNVSDKRCEF